MTSYCIKCGEPTITIGPLEQKVLDALRVSKKTLRSNAVCDLVDHANRNAVYHALHSLHGKGLIEMRNANPFGVRPSPRWSIRQLQQSEGA